MERILLRSGREVSIRPIDASDARGLRLAYERLSPKSKYQRFLTSKPYLTAADVRYLTEIDGADHTALVATPVDEPGYILGVGRYVRLAEDPQAAEFAVVVGDPFQGEGLGTALVLRLAQAARAHRITRFTASMLADNRPAHRLLHRLASTGLEPRAVGFHHGPVDEVVVDLAA